MNPNLNWAIIADRMKVMQAEADAVTRARHATRVRRAAPRARQARRSRRWLSFAPAGSGR